MASRTIIASKELIDEMMAYYDAYLLKPVAHSLFRAKKNNISITAYQSGKVLFQGGNEQAVNDAADYWVNQKGADQQIKKESKTKSSANLPDKIEQWTLIGSDEVGNGSYFGALTVCAVFLNPELMASVQSLGVKDSKELSDEQIISLAQILKKTVPYHLTICDPIDYNRGIQTKNANGIKVSLHNFTIQKLIQSLSDTDRDALQGVLIDQFTPRDNYLKHLKNESNPVVEPLYFAKKAESIHLAVACASIIARAAFLESLVRLGQSFHLVLPSGAGAKVDQIGMQLVRTYGEDVLKDIAKLHFRNTEKIMRAIQ